MIDITYLKFLAQELQNEIVELEKLNPSEENLNDVMFWLHKGLEVTGEIQLEIKQNRRSPGSSQ